VRVLAHYILPGRSGDYQAFMAELNDRARKQLKLRTPDLQAKGAVTPAALQAEFADYLDTLRRSNRLDTLVVVLDALDELPEPAPATPAVTDFLPPADKLPEGCVVVLTSRDPLRPRTLADVDRLRRAGGDAFVTLRIDPAAATNRAVLRAYLLEGDRLPPALRTPALANAVIDRAGGAFLYAYHLSRALTAGAFADVAALPEGPAFYPAYLARLRDRAGAALFDEVYLPALLLLAAAFEPVTLRQLHRWGVPRDRLAFALLDLHDFLRVHCVRGWHDSLADADAEPENRYEVAHEAFVRFVRDDPTLAAQLRSAHARIGLASLPQPPAGWSDLDPTDAAALYALRHVLPHLDASGHDDLATGVRKDEGYARACRSVGCVAQYVARFLIASDLYDRASTVYRSLVEHEGRGDLANDLAEALTSKGVALESLGRLPEGVAAHEEAIAALRPLMAAGRAELANVLAGAVTNKGAVLYRLGRLTEAVAAHEEAIAALRPLVAAGRAELANDLAKALVNKALALRKQGAWDEALACYGEAIHRREACVSAGMGHLLAELIQTIRYRLSRATEVL
jgi:tetratricopeptide (TPR) repeat protein